MIQFCQVGYFRLFLAKMVETGEKWGACVVFLIGTMILLAKIEMRIFKLDKLVRKIEIPLEKKN